MLLGSLEDHWILDKGFLAVENNVIPLHYLLSAPLS
jgi:hypothetical protein